ncbi:hypothetical protein B484DRAFT_409270 [Ochromonadaceae sp. CCMP2298]|nr:hypothetical protein B484DRAFT_409270 [Ochromonadaceae sp. CCMP2298]
MSGSSDAERAEQLLADLWQMFSSRAHERVEMQELLSKMSIGSGSEFRRFQEVDVNGELSADWSAMLG